RYLVFMLFFFFSFFSYFALLFLLSFPTRRSSDLLCEHSISYFSVHSLFLSISEHNLYYETFPVLSTVFGTYGSHHFVDKYTLQFNDLFQFFRQMVSDDHMFRPSDLLHRTNAEEQFRQFRNGDHSLRILRLSYTDLFFPAQTLHSPDPAVLPDQRIDHCKGTVHS